MDCNLSGFSDHGIFPGKNTGVGCHFLLQGIFPTQGLNLCLPHCREMLYHQSHQGSPWKKKLWQICSVLCLVTQSSLSFCDLVDCNPPGSPVHGYSPVRKTGVGCHALLQGIFPAQGSNSDLPHCRWILYCLSHQGRRDITLPIKVHIIKAMVFLVWMWDLDHKDGLELKNWYFQIVMLEKTLESRWDNKEIKPSNPKGNQSWIFIGRTDAEVPLLLSPDEKSRPIGEDTDAGKVWGQEKGMTEDEMVKWHHWFTGHQFEQTPGDNEGQGSLVCCSPWAHIGSDMTEQLHNNKSQETIKQLP